MEILDRTFTYQQLKDALTPLDIMIESLHYQGGDHIDINWKDSSSIKYMEFVLADACGTVNSYKGSENLYVTFDIYSRDGVNDYWLTLYSKDNISALKDVVKFLLSKF